MSQTLNFGVGLANIEKPIVGMGGSQKDDLLYRPHLIKKTTRGGRRGQKLPILRRHSLWTAPYNIIKC